MKERLIIVSACLAGLGCRYDGNAQPCDTVIRLVAEGKAIPLCPEQLGGLTTPRLPAEIREERVFRIDGQDITEAFEHGASEALKLAQLVNAESAILKARSPSCGSKWIYDGTFSGTVIPGDGIFAALCKENDINVKSEEEL